MSEISLQVLGVARPQGSKRFVGNRGGRGIMIESSAGLRPWRATVTAAAVEARAGAESITGPVNLAAVFAFPRPASHYGTGRNARVLKPSAPLYPSSHAVGDLSKLVRAIEDAITDAGLWRDDCQVVGYDGTEKRWCTEGEAPNTWIRVTDVS